MLYYFLRYEIGFEGLIGHFVKPVPLAAELALILVYVFIPYLLGSMNTAILVSKYMYHDDIRRYGSGNAGFTNVMRTYGGKAAAITFVGDIMKTVLAILVGWCVKGYLTAYIAGFACFLGHIFPVFHEFKGGKGILCLTAMLLMLDWRVFLILLAVFLGCVATTKYISFGSILGAMLYPIVLDRMINDKSPAVLVKGILVLIAVAIAAIVVIKHRGNLKRIFEGTESKFEFKKSKKVPEEEGTSSELPENADSAASADESDPAPAENGKGKKNGKR